MYNLQFSEAHRAFAEWEQTHPGDPMGPVSDAAASLFAEFNRLHILESEFFTDDARFLERERGLVPDPGVKRDFENQAGDAARLASAALARAPESQDALLAAALLHGLRADYLSLIEGRNVGALLEAKQARRTAERLLALHPDCYDAELAVGVENYLLSLKPLPVRWLLRLGGAEVDKKVGIEDLRITAAKGRYLLPYARVLLAIAALRDRDTQTARQMLSWLAAEFPNNNLYRTELQKLR